VRFALLAILAAGCTKTNPGVQGSFDLSIPPPIGDLASAFDLSVSALDLTSGSDDLAGLDLAGFDLARPDLAVVRDLAGADLAGGSCVRINEISTASAIDADDEYIELLNVCDQEMRIDGWTLRYRSADNNNGTIFADTILVNFGAFVIGAHAYRLFAGVKYGGSKDSILANGLSAIGGGVAIVDEFNFIVDSVAYGTVVPTHNFIEGAAATAPPAGSAIARSPDGHDTNQNSLDLLVTARTPRAANP
jgi:hypothetical protein